MTTHDQHVLNDPRDTPEENALSEWLLEFEHCLSAQIRSDQRLMDSLRSDFRSSSDANGVAAYFVELLRREFDTATRESAAQAAPEGAAHGRDVSRTRGEAMSRTIPEMAQAVQAGTLTPHGAALDAMARREAGLCDECLALSDGEEDGLCAGCRTARRIAIWGE